jgi:SAM-dependent methyltransferase
MRWTTKALIQRTLARLPFGRQAYTLGQSWVGGLRNYRIDGKLDQALRVRDALRAAGQTLTDRIALEIGTGWLPVAPMFYWLLGLRCCYAFDIDRLLSSRLTVAAAAQLIEIIEQPVRAPGDWRADLRSDRVEALRQLVRRGANHQEILVTCAIDYHAPADAAATGLPIGTVDVVFSSTVLEHVPTEDIGRLFREAYRILRPGAVMAT